MTRDVADTFDKRHTHVLEAIDVLLTQLPNGDQPNFRPISYTDAGGRTYRSYDMTRDGFTLLAMGFTGPTAPYRLSTR